MIIIPGLRLYRDLYPALRCFIPTAGAIGRKKVDRKAVAGRVVITLFFSRGVTLKDAPGFEKAAGGAPAYVAVVY
jgi:hypothetical protein